MYITITAKCNRYSYTQKRKGYFYSKFNLENQQTIPTTLKSTNILTSNTQRILLKNVSNNKFNVIVSFIETGHKQMNNKKCVTLFHSSSKPLPFIKIKYSLKTRHITFIRHNGLKELFLPRFNSTILLIKYGIIKARLQYTILVLNKRFITKKPEVIVKNNFVLYSKDNSVAKINRLSH